MKDVVIALLLTGFGLPWFHTRPKPVLLDATAKTEKRVFPRNSAPRGVPEKRAEPEISPPASSARPVINPASNSKDLKKPQH